MTFISNYLYDKPLSNLITYLNQFEKLTHIEISNNALRN